MFKMENQFSHQPTPEELAIWENKSPENKKFAELLKKKDYYGRVEQMNKLRKGNPEYEPIKVVDIDLKNGICAIENKHNERGIYKISDLIVNHYTDKFYFTNLSVLKNWKGFKGFEYYYMPHAN